MTNGKFSFIKLGSQETDATDAHRLMIAVVETNFAKPEFQKLAHQNYDYFKASSCRVWMTHALRNNCADYRNFENRFGRTYVEKGLCYITTRDPTIHDPAMHDSYIIIQISLSYAEKIINIMQLQLYFAEQKSWSCCIKQINVSSNGISRCFS